MKLVKIKLFIFLCVMQCGSSYTERIILKDVNNQIKKARRYFKHGNYVCFEAFIADAEERLSYLPKLRANVYLHSMLEEDQYCYLLENGLIAPCFARHYYFWKRPIAPMIQSWKE